MSLAGLYAVDAVLPDAEIATIAGRMQRGEDALQACEACPVNTYGPGAAAALALGQSRFVSLVTARALALTPGRAQLATLATRATRPGVNTAVYDPVLGIPPDGIGAVTFVRANVPLLDGGAHTFNIASGGGLTVVAVFMVTTAANGAGEILVDFGNGPSNNNIYIARYDTNKVLWGINNGDVLCYVFTESVIVQNVWLTMVGTYNAADRRMNFNVNNVVISDTCANAVTDRNVLYTRIGRSHGTTPHFEGRLAGLYAVDALLSPFEIAQIVNAMQVGDNVLQVCSAAAACVDCAPSSVSPAGSALATDCSCAAGTQGANGGTCQSCGAGTYTPVGGGACVACPANSGSPAGDRV